MIKLLLAIVSYILLPASLVAQTEKFDIATFVPPTGWERMERNGTVSFMHSKAVTGGTVLGQIVLHPSKVSSGNVANDFRSAWNDIVVASTKTTAQPKTETTKTTDGWDVMTGTAIVTFSGITYNSSIVTATGFGKTMSVQVNSVGSEYLSAISKFFDQLTFDAKATVGSQQASRTIIGQTNTGLASTLADYDFTPPPRWQIQRAADHVRIQSAESGCLIIVFAPQPSSGDLERDAKAVFDTMYKGWQFQKAGEQRYTLSKGLTPQGLEFFMMEGVMGKLSADGARYEGFEDGAALVVKAGSQIAIISVRHNSSIAAHNDCHQKYEYWRRFFNNFTVRNAPVASPTENPPSRIVGRWVMSESGASGDYVFAANGNYALIGALGSTSTSSDSNYDYLHIKTYAFPGDGSYSIAGDQLTLRRRGGDPEQVRFRFEKVNHAGTGWRDRLYLLKKDRIGESEAGYEKRGK